MLISDGRGRRVVSTNSAETLGIVDTFIVDPELRRVVAVELSKVAGRFTVLPWERLAFGADAVTTGGITDLVVPEGYLAVLADRHHAVLGKRVLDTAGRELGSVRDVDIDPTSGAVISLLVGDVAVPGAALIGIGTYAVVVAAA
jgi:sporulation protein YlmC with PRC-barrel domain